MRINAYLARSGLGSRRGCENFVRENRVYVNGALCSELSYKVKEGDTITLDGELIVPEQITQVFLLNKPKGYICTRNDPQNRRLVIDLLPPEYQKMQSVGRLDYDSSGLLLFTNDGSLAQKLTQPIYQIPRTYLCYLDSIISDSQIGQMAQGLEIEFDNGRGKYFKHFVLPKKLKKLPKGVEITLNEGKNRELRKLFAGFGFDILDLHRIQYGPISLGDLELGSGRRLLENEVADLLSCFSGNAYSGSSKP